jgi:hypothetical protein
MSGEDVTRYIDTQDCRGDTALTIAARFGARKLVRSLIGHGGSTQIRNRNGQTADQLLTRIHDRPPPEINHMGSSSPFQPDSYQTGGRGSRNDHASNMSQLLPNNYHSEAAQALSSKVAPAIIEQTKKLAEAFDAELKEKEADLKEACRLLSCVTAELDSVNQQIAQLEAEEPTPSEDEREEAELAALEAESLRVLTIANNKELEELMAEAEGKWRESGGDTNGTTNDNEEELLQRLEHEKAMRHKLLKEIVHHTANVGTSDKIPQYRLLISKALGMDEDKVEEALPGILAELELNRKSDVAVLRGVGAWEEGDMMGLDG